MKKRIVTGIISASLALASVAVAKPYLGYNQWISVAGYGDASVLMHFQDMSNPVVTFAGQGVDYFAWYPMPGLGTWDGLLLYQTEDGALVEGLFYQDFLY